MQDTRRGYDLTHKQKLLSNIEQATMGHPSQRSGRLFFLAAFAFCGAALVTGFCFVYAVQAGLERLAFYHPFASEQTNLGSVHPVTPLIMLLPSPRAL